VTSCLSWLLHRLFNGTILLLSPSLLLSSSSSSSSSASSSCHLHQYLSLYSVQFVINYEMLCANAVSSNAEREPVVSSSDVWQGSVLIYSMMCTILFDICVIRSVVVFNVGHWVRCLCCLVRQYVASLLVVASLRYIFNTLTYCLTALLCWI